jgi:hypothetical protein
VPTALRRLPLDLLVPALVAATIVAATLRAGSISSANAPMANGRWIAYALLALVAVAAALRLRAVPPLVPSILWTFLLGLAAASSLWSPASRTTLSAAAAFALVTFPGLVLAGVIRVDARYAERIVLGLVTGAGLVCAGGLVLLAVDPNLALYTPGAPDIRHLRGLGGNPNTVALLLAIAIPPTAWLACSRRPLTRTSALALWLLEVGTLIGSGSRGSALGAAAGTAVVALFVRRTARVRVALVLSAVVLLVVDTGVQRVREPPALPTPIAASLVADPATPPPPRIGNPGGLSYELGRSTNSSFGSGRFRAWWGAVQQTAHRPVGGYGFGMETHAFVDRYAQFQGSFVESSYVGAALQLGIAGASALAVLLLFLGRESWRARHAGTTDVSAALAGAAAGGAIIGAVQSYILFAGSVGAPAFWLCAFAAAGLASRGLPPGRRVLVAAIGAAVTIAAICGLGALQARNDTRAQQRGIERVRALAGPLDGPRLSAFRITYNFDCLLYRQGGDPYALELCYDDGRLVEAIDRRGNRPPRFWSLRFDMNEAPGRVSEAAMTRALERVGAISYSQRFLEGYPPRLATADSTPVLVEDWLRAIRRARGAASGSA